MLMGPSATSRAELCFPVVPGLSVPLPGLLPSHTHTVAVVTPTRATHAPGCMGPVFLTLKGTGFGGKQTSPQLYKVKCLPVEFIQITDVSPGVRAAAQATVRHRCQLWGGARRRAEGMARRPAPAPRALRAGLQVAPLPVQLPVAAFLLTAHVTSGPPAERGLCSVAAPRLLDLTVLTLVPDDPDIAAQKPHETVLAVGSCASPAQTGRNLQP